MRKYIHNITFYLLHLFLLLIQWAAIQLQQCGCDTHRQVIGVHLVDVCVLKNVMEDTNKMLQEEFVVPRENIYHPDRGKEEKREQEKPISLALFFFCSKLPPFFFKTEDILKKRSGLVWRILSMLCKTPFKNTHQFAFGYTVMKIPHKLPFIHECYI